MWDVFFPRFCITCSDRLKDKEKLVCPSCLDLLYEFEAPYQLTPFYFTLPLWEKKGIPESFLSLFIQGKTFLADVFAAFIVMRYCEYELDLPDAITYIPTKPYVKWSQGFCAKKRIAESCAKMLNIPCIKTLKWQGDELIAVGSKETRLLVIETNSDDELSIGGIELEKRELVGVVIATSSDERNKTCRMPIQA